MITSLYICRRMDVVIIWRRGVGPMICSKTPEHNFDDYNQLTAC